VNTFADITALLRTRWHGLTERGRIAIVVAASLLSVGLFWALVYAPIQQSRLSNRAAIATNATQLALMRAQAAEVQQLRAMAPVAATSNRSLADTAGLSAIFGTTAAVSLTAATAQTPAQFRVTLKDASFSSVIERLDAATLKYRLRVAGLELVRSPANPGSVSGEVLLQDTR
jgi:type II secretory pathway component PulM